MILVGNKVGRDWGHLTPLTTICTHMYMVSCTHKNMLSVTYMYMVSVTYMYMLSCTHTCSEHLSMPFVFQSGFNNFHPILSMHVTAACLYTFFVLDVWLFPAFCYHEHCCMVFLIVASVVQQDRAPRHCAEDSVNLRSWASSQVMGKSLRGAWGGQAELISLREWL